MYEIRPVSAAACVPLQGRLSVPDCHPETGQHLLETILTDRLGAFTADGELVALAFLFPLDRDGRQDHTWRRLDGPFITAGHEGCHTLLLGEAAASLGRRASLWHNLPRPVRKPGEYSADDIVILTGLMAVRKRPGMFVGGVGPDAVRELIFEPLSNSIDEHLAGHASTIWIEQDERGGWTVTDDGRGIPVGWVEQAGLTALEAVLLRLHTGSHLGTKRLHAHAGLMGRGLSVLNALSAACTVEVEHGDGRRYRQAFSRGTRSSFLAPIPATGRRGTKICFLPDEEIFSGIEAVTPATIRPRLAELVCLNPALTIHLQGEVLSEPRGLRALAEQRAGQPLRDVVTFSGEREGVIVSGVVGWRPGPPVEVTFCNQSPTPGGGSHADGARQALATTAEEGRVLVLHVSLADAAYSGRTRSALNMPHVAAVVASVVDAAHVEAPRLQGA